MSLLTRKLLLAMSTAQAPTGWVITNNVLAARRSMMGAGSQSAAIMAAGITNTSTPLSSTEEYNGDTWSAASNLTSAARYDVSGNGTATAALLIGGNNFGTRYTTVDEWDSGSWAAAPSLTTERSDHGSTGSISATIAVGGQDSLRRDETILFNGVTWTDGVNMGTDRSYPTVVGTQISALVMGGYPITNSVELYNGSTYSVEASLNVQRYAASSAGNSIGALIWGGETFPNTEYATTESYDSVSWAMSDDTNVVHRFAGGDGNSNNALTMSGIEGGANTAVTEEYSSGVQALGTWSAGANLPTEVLYHVGSGTQTAGLSFGGSEFTTVAVNSAATNEYNGSAWTSSGNMLRTSREHAGAGTQTATFTQGGRNDSDTHYDDTATYDGSVWSANAATSYLKLRDSTACGTTTAGLLYTGRAPGGYEKAFLEFNGSTWVYNAPATPAHDTLFSASCGTQTAALIIGGQASTSDTSQAWEYNGLAQIALPDYTVSVRALGASGTPTAATVFGGYRSSISANTTLTNEFNSISWTTSSSLNTERSYFGDAGSSNDDALAIGGYNSSGRIASTEEYYK